MGRASLDRLGTGSSTGSGRAPARLRERPCRLSVGRRRPADPARHSRSPPPSGFRPARLARAWRASACALAAALVLPLLLGAGAAQAHDEGATGHVHLKLGLDRTSCPNCAHAPTGTAEPGPGLGEITLRWEPATTGPQGNFVRWHIHAKKQTTGNVNRWVQQITNAQTRSFTLTGLETGVTWTVGVEMRRRTDTSIWAGDIGQARLEALSLAADAGDDVTVRAGARVALDGTGSAPATVTYAWTQNDGPTVTLDDATSATPAFIAPSVSMQTDLTFSLTVNDGTASEEDTVTVTVLPSRVESATVDGAELSVTFDTALDTNSRPASSAFTVTASKSGASRTIAGTGALVGISGAKVTATLSAPVAADERLTVRYDKPASGNVLKDSSNNELPSFADRPAGNAGDMTPPTFVSASMNGTTLRVVFDETLVAAGASGDVSNNRFRVTHGGSARDSTGVSISGATATATFAAADAPGHGESVGELFYLQSNTAADRLADQSGNAIAVPDGLSLTLLADPVPNVTPPAFSSATVDGDELTVTFDGDLDPNAVPAGSAFTVKGTRSGTESTLSLAATNPVSVSGSEVTLTLAEAVLRVDTVTVAYAAPATGDKLQDADNAQHPVPDFAAKTATNATPADTTRPRFVSASINGATVTVTFDETLDTGFAPSQDVFFGSVDGVATSGDPLHNVSISGRTVTVTYLVPAQHGQAVTVGYNLLSVAVAKRLRDLSGNQAVGFVNKTATNVTPPAFSSATVDGDELTVTFDGDLDPNAVPAGSAFTVKGTRSGTESTLSLAATNPVSVSGSEVTLTLAEAVLRVDTVTVAYAAPATGDKLQDADNAQHPVPDFAAKTATNATPADTTRPRFVSASINGATVTVTFDETLDTGFAPSQDVFFGSVDGVATSGDPLHNVSISGRTVTVTYLVPAQHGQAVTVGYNLLSVAVAKRLRDLSGNQAVGFVNKTATNVTPPAFSSATVDGDELTVTFDGDLDPNAVPAGSAFTVKGTRSGTESTLSLAATNPVSVSGSEVTLTLAEAVLRVDTVTVAYAAPATGDKLQDADNAQHPVPDFAAKTATNATPADTTRPRFVSASINGATVTVTFDETLDTGFAPSQDVFFGSVDGVATSGDPLHNVSISGRTVTVTYLVPAQHGQAVTVGYNLLSVAVAKRLRDLSGNQAVGFVNKTATNVTPPAFSSATVDGDELTVTFDGDLDPNAVPAGSAFTVKGTRSGTESTLSLAATNPVSVSGSEVTLTLAEAVLRVDTVTVAYAAPATGDKLQDADNAQHPVPDFAAKTATNATPADTTRPRFVSASINGATVTVTFDETLDTGFAPSQDVFFGSVDGVATSGDPLHNVSISGRTVTVTYLVPAQHGQAVTVGYNLLSVAVAKRLRDLSGNQAVGFVNKTATNVTPPAFSSATVDGDELTVTFDGDLDPNAVPAGSAFTVKGTRSGTESTLSLAATNPVAVSGKTVTLTLAEAVLPFDTVTVTYAAPATGDKLQDADKAQHPVPDFSAKTATNNSSDSTPPSFVSATVNGTKMTITFDEPLDETVAVPADRFGRLLALQSTDADSVSISGRTVTATFATAARHGQALGVKYRTPVDPALEIKDLSGNRVAGFIQPAANNTPPAFSSATVNEDVLIVTFDGALDRDAVPAGERVHGEGDALGGREHAEPGGHEPGFRRRLGGDARPGRGGAARRHGDGGLRGAGDGGEAPGLGQREAPGAGLRGPDRDQRHPGGHDGSGARLGVGERRGTDDFVRRGAGRERGGAGEGRLHGDGGRIGGGAGGDRRRLRKRADGDADPGRGGRLRPDRHRGLRQDPGRRRRTPGRPGQPGGQLRQRGRHQRDAGAPDDDPVGGDRVRAVARRRHLRTGRAYPGEGDLVGGRVVGRVGRRRGDGGGARRGRDDADGVPADGRRDERPGARAAFPVHGRAGGHGH